MRASRGKNVLVCFRRLSCELHVHTIVDKLLSRGAGQAAVVSGQLSLHLSTSGRSSGRHHQSRKADYCIRVAVPSFM